MWALQNAGPTSNINILVQFDTNKNITKRFRAGKRKHETLQTEQGVDSGDPKVLTDFLKLGMTNYPLRTYSHAFTRTWLSSW
jgi:hypothetical protein